MPMFILFVANQKNSRDFFSDVLMMKPILDVPGMTEFKLTDGSSLGLMPERGIQSLLSDSLPKAAFSEGGVRAEVYLLVDDPEQCLNRATDSGARLLSKCQARGWGDWAGYCLDTNGYILGFAKPLISSE
ncbi:MAG: glyoxalase [bacterium]|nr:glyoxalase [bacterium]